MSAVDTVGHRPRHAQVDIPSHRPMKVYIKLQGAEREKRSAMSSTVSRNLLCKKVAVERRGRHMIRNDPIEPMTVAEEWNAK